MSQDREDFGPIVRASNKQKAEARGYKRAMREMKGEPDRPQARHSTWRLWLGGVVAMLAGIMSVACLDDYMRAKVSTDLMAIPLGRKLASQGFDPDGKFFNLMLFSGFTLGGCYLFYSGWNRFTKK